MKIQIRAAYTKPDDIITVELRSMFALHYSASLSITRHGVDESCFSLKELKQVSHAIADLVEQIEKMNSIIA